ncbi:MAG: polysaccharide biosynthesis C-terminal domain-containing protein [Ruminiclostridium sp.]|nr:polysaccharide biosynthesis C-terminal domain-containing protein [Ruminiclostridium sp.]
MAKTMTEGAPWKHILKFSLPVLAGSLLQQLYNTVDTIIVGRYSGEDALSAVGTTGSFAFLFLALATGFSAGNGVVVAQQYGAKNNERVRANASTCILFLMILGVISAVIACVTATPAYTYLLNVDESIIDLTVTYFRWYAIGLVFRFGCNIFSAILRAVGDSAATLYFLLISSVLNIGLDMLFVAVFDWGVAGAAVATDISQAVSFVAAYFYMSKKYPIFRFRLNEYKWNRSLLSRLRSRSDFLYHCSLSSFHSDLPSFREQSMISARL